MAVASSDREAGLARHLVRMTDAQYRAWSAALTPEDRRIADEVRTRAIAEALQAGWRATPHTMARELEGDEWADFRFQRFLAQNFADAVNGVAPYQTWSLPAQVGKTECLRRCIAWALDRRPQDPIILTAYGASLAVNSARFIRDYGVRYADRLRFRLRADASKIGEWLTTEGGGLKATGIGGGLSGFPGAGLAVDDPHKNWQEAHSLAAQEAVWDTWRSVLRLRLRMGGWVIVLHTRWAPRDLTGRIEDEAAAQGEEWRHVVLPMIAEENDQLGRTPGEVLEPLRYDIPAAMARARALGSYLSAALEQQRPAPPEGGVLKRSWWLVDPLPPPAFDQLITSWDMKIKDVARKGDDVAGQCWGRVGPHYYMLHQLRGQWSFLQTKVAVALMQVRYPACNRHYMENTGNGPEVMRDLRKGEPATFTLDDDTVGALGITEDERPRVDALLRRGMSGLIPNSPKGDKFVRAVAISGVIEGGNVHLIAGPEAENLINEAAAFPKGARDDAVDAMSQALAILTGTPGTTSVVSTASRPLPQPEAGRGLPTQRPVASTAARRLPGAGPR